MNTFRKSLLTLTAAELMKRPVVTIPQGMSLQAAARLLKREQITGAPVVDDEGHCVGVLSATDFLSVDEKKECKERKEEAIESCFCEWQVIDVDALPRDEVRSFMSREVVTASGTTAITELARTMLDAHIHRIFVVDASRRPVGVVSSTDIIAAVAYAEAPSRPAPVNVG